MTGSPPTPKPGTAASPGALRQLGKYRIERQLGIGGMGIVYLAVDDDLKRTVALKVLAKDRATNPTLVRRFKAEGQAAAVLQHKNIVNVYESGQADGYLFLALEYVDGVDVLEWMRKRGVLSVKRSLEIVRQVAEALQHAYEKNIVHRDIKPSNLMIARDGTVKVTDMGLARSIDDTLDTTITRDGTTVGTVDYMSPEQATNSKAADIRSDIYSLGCTWYHMLTGSPPYPEGSVTNKLGAHVSAPLPNPRLLNDRIPEAVVAVIHRMMAKKKDQRYQTPLQLLEDLQSDGLMRGSDAVDLLAMFNDDGGTADPSGSGEVATADSGSAPTIVNRSPRRPAGERGGTGPRQLLQRGGAARLSSDSHPTLGTSGRTGRRLPPVHRPDQVVDNGARKKQRLPFYLDSKGIVLLLVIVMGIAGAIWWASLEREAAPIVRPQESSYSEELPLDETARGGDSAGEMPAEQVIPDFAPAVENNAGN
ncbi:serine/threonine-protein kinase [Planctomicrobium sp. SH664]|uniref:serine/threonine-protein kinase n=1 Tax=Planctomicrobium sp. SH664 TaxID=3448125 RepID=UPI003F5BB0E1